MKNHLKVIKEISANLRVYYIEGSFYARMSREDEKGEEKKTLEPVHERNVKQWIHEEIESYLASHQRKSSEFCITSETIDSLLDLLKTEVWWGGTLQQFKDNMRYGWGDEQ